MCWHPTKIDPPMAREAIRRLTRLEACIPKEIIESTAVTSLEIDDKFWLADTFNHSREDVPIAVALWEQILGAGDLPAGSACPREALSRTIVYGIGAMFRRSTDVSK